MKKAILIIIPIIMLFGCSTEGDLKIINKTNHNIYFTIKGTDYVLEGDSDTTYPSKTVTLNSGKKFLFFEGDGKKVNLHLEGETFMMQHADNFGVGTGEFVTETEVTIKPNETTKIYTWPATHASVKVINNSGKDIVNFFYNTSYDQTLVFMTDDIPNGITYYSRLDYTTNQNLFFYEFKIVFDDFTEQTFGGPDATLYLDEQFLIDLVMEN
ncbi:MAG: hypothetical protein HQ534_05955 [Armatimonadetes bacterium]|nr:hypothetical protein [Armatimonadota bacterium]